MSICSIEDIAGATKAPFWFHPLHDARPRRDGAHDRALKGRPLQRARLC
jgi:hypothetical protein